MQKENDQVGGDKESKEERTQHATEGTGSKRIRENTPSPQRVNTPQGEKQDGLLQLHRETAMSQNGSCISNPTSVLLD